MPGLAAKLQNVPDGKPTQVQKPGDLKTVPIPTAPLVAAEGLFSGTLEEISLSDFLQLLEMGLRSAEITIWAQSLPGILILDQGKLVHAEVGKLRGERAFFEICSWRSGEIRVRPLRVSPTVTIDSSLSFLLLEYARQMDSRGQDRDPSRAEGLEAHPSPALSPNWVTSGDSKQEEVCEGRSTIEERIRQRCAVLLAGGYDVVCAAIITSGEPQVLGGAFSRDFSHQQFTGVTKSVLGAFHRLESVTPSHQGASGKQKDVLAFDELELSSPDFHFVFRVLNPRPVMACLAAGRGESLGMARALLNAALPELSTLVELLNLEQ